MARECVITLPKFHPKQQLAFDSKATQILFAGDTRAGKSFFIRKAYIIWCSQIPDLITDIFRLHEDDVIAENMKGDTSFPVLLHEWKEAGLVTINQTEIKFWNGSRINLNHCSDDKVMMKHQGNACHVRTFAEATQIPERRLRELGGWVTMSEKMKARVPEQWRGLFPKIFYATNPVGPSTGYFERHFVFAREPYSIEKVGPWMRQYIPAFVNDNPSEDEQATRERIAESFPDQAKQDALLSKDPKGRLNWTKRTGLFFTEWDEDRHVCADFTPPSHWYRYRVFDWGTAEPAYCAWIAISDGEPFRDELGRERWFPRGSIIVHDEWYICDPKDPAKGLRMRNADMARGIVDRTDINFRNCVTLTDSKPFQDTGGDGPAAEFARNGCPLSKADTSRPAGWSQFRSRLIGIDWGFDDKGKPIRLPTLYICKRCHAARDYIPQLPSHPSDTRREDAADSGETTHACDAIRYACMAHNSSVIKDLITPTQRKIDEAMRQSRPTVKKIIGTHYLG